ncbi:MAG: CDP-alcohol phosphatidyltransferase family protein [bacterium]
MFIIFGILDYVEGILAHYHKMETVLEPLFACLTDLPILLTLSLFCLDVIPLPLLILKIVSDIILALIYITERRRTENRLIMGINFTTLFALLVISQGWASKFITRELVIYFLFTNITFSGIVILYNLGILQKRYIADALSGSNLLCGIFSMLFAAKSRVDISLLFLMMGAAFDGFDGAAARKFGGTWWGVYSDDVADGVNYGIAPGVALYYTLGNLEGIIVGIFFSCFTLSRLVYFTLNKIYSDPDYFCGVPSTVGALVALCSLILFNNHPAIIGLMVGIACIQMVSFDTHYRHLGRVLASNRRIIYGMPVFIGFLLVGNILWGIEVPVAIILGASCVYGFFPTVAHFVRLVNYNSRK